MGLGGRVERCETVFIIIVKIIIMKLIIMVVIKRENKSYCKYELTPKVIPATGARSTIISGLWVKLLPLNVSDTNPPPARS